MIFWDCELKIAHMGKIVRSDSNLADILLLIFIFFAVNEKLFGI